LETWVQEGVILPGRRPQGLGPRRGGADRLRQEVVSKIVPGSRKRLAGPLPMTAKPL